MSAGPPIIVASALARPSSPRSESTICSSRSWAESARRNTAYCSFTSREAARSVMAMNGTSYGTSNTGNPCASAVSRSVSGTRACENPVPNPSPVRPCATSRSTYARSSPACRPVVSSSSPPVSHGVGSSSSEMCTQRTARSSPAAPATTGNSSSPSKLPQRQHPATLRARAAGTLGGSKS